jgi:ABC-type lipoprotein export system ATPase subunit
LSSLPLYAVELENVSKLYRNGLISALNEINLTIPDGNFTIIGGPSGAGKSTLLNLIGGLDRPDKGNIIILRRDYGKMSESDLTRFRRKHIGFIWQFSNLFPSLTALQNTMMPLEFDPTWKYREAKARSHEVLDYLGLERRYDHKPGQLSGGEQQRVSIARALVNNPSLILADEPTGNLDYDNGCLIAELLKRLNKEQKITIIVVSHDTDLFKKYGQITPMKDGRIIQ